MSMSDVAAPQDSSHDSNPSSTISPLHPEPVILNPTASDSANSFSLCSEQQQQNPADTGSSSQASSDASLNQLLLGGQIDELLLPSTQSVEVDDGDEEGLEHSPEELVRLLKSTRQPPPGVKRVAKVVRVRGSLSSSKKRTKKRILRAQLKETARIEEMTGYRGKRERLERRPPIIESGSSSRGRPSGLRFSENCYSDKEDEVEGGQGEGNEVTAPELSIGLQQSPDHQPDPDTLVQKTQTPYTT